jgi:DNA mismatch repair protein MutH
MIHLVPPPNSVAELLSRSRQLAGKSLSELTLSYKISLPTSLTQAKGFIGQLIEWHLGASANNLPQPDFPNLGIELKTLPLSADGLPRESTYVCTAPLQSEREGWETSRVRKKLARVLWIPIEADNTIPLMDRRVGNPLLWELDPKTELILKQDWEELSLMIQLGQIEKLSAKIGTYLQIRPKAAHSRIVAPIINEHSDAVLANPKGFYLRTIFTKQILQGYFCKTSNNI